MTEHPRSSKSRELRALVLAGLLSAILLLSVAWFFAVWMKKEVAPDDDFITEFIYEPSEESEENESTPPDEADHVDTPTPSVDERAAAQTSPPPKPPTTSPPEELPVETPEEVAEMTPPDTVNRQSVDQPTTNQELPETDDYYLAEVDNRAEVETQAENATREDQEEASVDVRAMESEQMEVAQLPSPTREEQRDATDEPSETTPREHPLDDAHDVEARGVATATERETQRQEARPSDERSQTAQQAGSEATQAQETTPFEVVEGGEVRAAEGALQASEAARATGMGARMQREMERLSTPGSGRDSVTRGGVDYARTHADEVFGETTAQAEARAQAQRRRESLFGDHAGDWQRTREAMENYDIAVTAGSETQLNTRRDEHAGFINAFHRRIHDEWWSVLTLLDRRYGPSENISNRDLTVRLEIRVMGDGRVDRVRIVNTSGNTFFDAEAVRVNYSVGRTAAPSSEILCGDGSVYLHWTFSRMPGRCGTHGASVHCPG